MFYQPILLSGKFKSVHWLPLSYNRIVIGLRNGPEKEYKISVKSFCNSVNIMFNVSFFLNCISSLFIKTCTCCLNVFVQDLECLRRRGCCFLQPFNIVSKANKIFKNTNINEENPHRKFRLQIREQC